MSKETTHTPGPWVAVFENEEPEPAVMSGKYYVAVACFGVDSGSSESNARLIAAAPDLLEALIELAEYADGFSVSGVYLNEEIEGSRLMKKAFEAIAKAYGREA